MSFSVRRAKWEDAQVACSVVRRSIEECCHDDHRGNPDRLEAWLKNKTPGNFLGWIQSDELFCAVVEEESRVVGFGMSSTDEVLLCYVVPEALHRGAGKAMLQSIENWAVTSDTFALRLVSTRTATAFYRRNGFENCGPVAVFAGMEGYPLSKRLMAHPLHDLPT